MVKPQGYDCARGEEEEQMERWLVFLAAVLLIGVPIDLFRTYDMLELFARTMQALLLGEPAEELAFQGVAPDALLTPLTEASLQRIRACREVRRAEVQVDYASRWWFFRRSRLRVRYDFEGVTEAGETVVVQEQALIRVAYYCPGRYGAGTPIVTGVTLLPEARQG